MEGINFNGSPMNGAIENNREEVFITPQINHDPRSEITLQFSSPLRANNDEDLLTPISNVNTSALTSPADRLLNTPIELEVFHTDDILPVDPNMLLAPEALEELMEQDNNHLTNLLLRRNTRGDNNDRQQDE